MSDKLLLLLAVLALPLVGCPADDDDDSASTGDDDTAPAGGITIRGVVHELGAFGETVSGVTVVIANPTPMLVQGEDPEPLGFAEAAADGSFEITGVDATGADMGLIMIVDDNGEQFLAVATGIHASEYEGWTDGWLVEDQIAFAAPTATVAAIEADLASAGWTGSDLFATGALMGFVQETTQDAVAGATVSSVFGDEVYYADGDPLGSGAFDDGSGTPNVETTIEGDALWLSPGGAVSSWSCEAEGYTFDPIMVGSTSEVLVVIAFRPGTEGG